MIESVSPIGGPSATIKSHHNVGGLPDDLQFELIEPVRELFKDEVRALGRELGLPDEIVDRQPFPGPGLAVRILGEVTAERVDAPAAGRPARAGGDRQAAELPRHLAVVRRPAAGADAWASWATAAPTRTSWPCASCESMDGMTADWFRVPYDVLGAHLQPHHQRGARRQPRRLRHQLQAARHDRVGVTEL